MSQEFNAAIAAAMKAIAAIKAKMFGGQTSAGKSGKWPAMVSKYLALHPQCPGGPSKLALVSVVIACTDPNCPQCELVRWNAWFTPAVIREMRPQAAGFAAVTPIDN
jgi:hypothetical protein